MVSNKEFSRLCEEWAREDYDKIRSWPERISSLEEENRRLREALTQSLRQWNMYAELYDETDLDKEDSTEAEMYRAARAALSQEQKP